MTRAHSLFLHWFLCLFLSVTFFSTTAYAYTGQVTTSNTAASGVLIKFKPTITANSLNTTFSAAGCTASQWFQIVPGLAFAKLDPNSTMEQTLLTLQQDPNVEYAEPNYIVRAMETIPNDPDFDSLYGLNNTGQTSGTVDADIDAPQAWDLETGTDVVIAVIDSGVDYTHEDLRDNIWTNEAEIPDNGIDDDGNGSVDDYHGWDFANNDNDPMDDHFHGTHVAGTIAAAGNNGIGVTGVNWKARIMPLKFLGSDGSGSLQAAIGAIEYAAKMGARVSNNSWGGGPYSQALHDAIVNAENQGHLFVAAAGNDGSNNDITPAYPATYNLPNIISVAATDHNDNLASFSNYGATTVDLGAPGVDIYSLSPGNGYRFLSGTSMATPHVTGVAGLLFAANPALSYQEVKAAILDNVDPVNSLSTRTVTKGRLNAFKALDSLRGTLKIDPASAQVALGATQQFTVSGGTAPYQWSVDDPIIGSINTNGLFLGLAAGVTGITVLDDAGLTGTSNAIEVTQTSVTPATTRLAPGQSLQFNATGGTAPYTWSSSNPTVADVNADGLVTATDQAGTTTITATDANGISDTTGDINVVPATLTIVPDSAVVGVGDTLQFSVENGSAPYTWSTTDAAVATIDSNGQLTARAEGTIMVNVEDKNGDWGVSGIIEVRNISIEPNTASLSPGATLQFSATGGVAPYAWEVSDTQIAAIDADGLLTGVAGGTVTVTAIDNDLARGMSGTITINGNSTPQIEPANVVLQAGEQFQFRASGGFPSYTWSSSNPFVATIDQSTGLLSAVGSGLSFVQIRDLRGNIAQALVQVKNIQLYPQSRTINVGQYVQFSAYGGRFPYTWSVSDSSVASISSAGQLIGLSAGTVTVTATDADGLQGVSGNITIAGNTTPPPPTNPITITPSTGTVATGATLQFSVSGGTPPYQWSVSNPFVARIDTSGLLTGLAAGTVTVAVRDASGAIGYTGLITVVTAATPLQVTPQTANLVVGQNLQFRASGGKPPYTWRVNNPLLATISTNGLFTATSAGTTQVTVTDNNGVSVSTGNIFIASGTAPQKMTVSPTTAQLTVGETLQFTVTGGVAPYTWTSFNSIAGDIDNNGLFTAKGTGLTGVRVRDSLGAIADTSFIQVFANNNASQDDSGSGNGNSANDTDGGGGGSTSLLLIMFLLSILTLRIRKFVR